MNRLTSQQKIENYRELIDNNRQKIQNLQNLNKSLEAKVSKLCKNSEEMNSLLKAANASNV